MAYVNFMSSEQMKDFGLFDNIPYKYIKNLKNDEIIMINIKDIKKEKNDTIYKTQFKFVLIFNKASDNSSPRYFTKKYKIILKYKETSSITFKLLDLIEDNRNVEVLEDF